MTWIKNNLWKIGYWAFAILAGTSLGYMETLEDSEPTFSILTFIYFALLIFWGIRWIVAQIKSTLQQKQEKINLELIHLQSQISPHFFFNTMNNLYGWMDKDIDQAKQLVLQLSEMMRYSIYQGQQEYVTIDQEIEYLKKYIDLHQMRYRKEIDIQFDVAVENDKMKVLPLLFITLLENAFKHGVENLRADAFVHIKMIGLEDTLSFEVENNFDPQALNKEVGIGLKNLERRLEIAYPKKHEYAITKKESTYQAKLKLQTA